MSNLGLSVVLVANLIVAAGYFRKGDGGMALVFTSYAFSCVGFMWSNWRAM
jgi:UDP-N-acetylmuramyl pentapeptide phosphotransferase/UDP-N-acetylglucosamine-1-phosphate transferase